MALNKLFFPLDEKLTLPQIPANFLTCQWLNDLLSSEIWECSQLPFAKSPITYAIVKSATYVTNHPDVKSTLELNFNIGDNNFDYEPGDTIAVLPENSVEDVENLINLLQISDKARNKCEISSRKDLRKIKPVPFYLPPVTSAKYILTKCLDIKAPPRKLFLRALSVHTKNDVERRRLEELCSKEGACEYTEIIMNNGYSIIDILSSFRSCQPPFSVILEHLPRLQPRVYSIASSPLSDKTFIKVVFRVVKRPDGSPGICSSYLSKIVEEHVDLNLNFSKLNINVKEDKKVPIYLRIPTKFRMPEDPETPMIMVGPGTGVAPFIGFLEHREMLLKQTKSTPRGDCWLFFGCRNDNDFIFKKEIYQFYEKNILTRLFVSFSQACDVKENKKYVQDHIKNIKNDFIEMMSNGQTVLFICGDAKNMVKDVMETIRSCFKDVKDLTADEAEVTIENLIKSNRILTDSWV